MPTLQHVNTGMCEAAQLQGTNLHNNPHGVAMGFNFSTVSPLFDFLYKINVVLIFENFYL